MTNIEGLKRLALAATPGQWEWWTSNSHVRLTARGGPDGGVIGAYRASDGQSCVRISEDDQAFIEAAQPKTILDLIDRLERAEKAQIPAGWKLVPIDLNDDMIDATLSGTVQVQCVTTQMRHREYLRENYRKQLNAAPSAPTQEPSAI